MARKNRTAGTAGTNSKGETVSSSSTKTRRSRDVAAESRPPAGTNRPSKNGTQNVSFRFPIRLVEQMDLICQANHWTRGSFVSRVFAAGLAAEAERLGQQDLAEQIRREFP